MNNTIKGIYLVFLGRIIALCSLGLICAHMFQQLTLGNVDMWIRLSINGISFVSAVVVFGGLLKLYRQNTYFKIAFVIQPINIITNVIFALAAELHQIFIPAGDIWSLLSSLLALVSFFCWLWGISSLVKKNGLLRLSKRFKVFPFAMLIFAILWFIVWLLLAVFLSIPFNIAFTACVGIAALVWQVYELYLLHFARTQLSSEKPKDIGGIFGVIEK